MSRWDWVFYYVLLPFILIIWAAGIAFNEQAIRNWEEVGRITKSWEEEAREARIRKLELESVERLSKCKKPVGEDDE